MNPNGKSLTIVGDNATGKTTVGDALTWLLFDKDMTGRSAGNFGIKTRDVKGDVMHNLDHMVEAAFDNGMHLRKVYQEKWGGDKGSTEKVLKTHSTTHYVSNEDGLLDEVSKEKYNQVVAEVMDEELFKILSVPDYFLSQLHWTKRRPVLKDMAGSIKFDDVIKTDERLSDLPGILNGMSISACESSLKGDVKELREQAQSIPSSIIELRGQVEEIPSDIGSADDLIAKRKELEKKLSEHELGGGVHELTQKLHELESERFRLSNEHEASIDEQAKGTREKLSGLQQEIDGYNNTLRRAKVQASDFEHEKSEQVRELNRLEKELEQLVNTTAPVSAESGDCPYCGKPMDNHELKKAEKELKDFNASKANEIKQVKADIADTSKRIKSTDKKVADAKSHAEKLLDTIESMDVVIEKLEKKYEEFFKSAPKFSQTDACKEIEIKIEQLSGKIFEFSKNKKEATDKLNDQISQIDDQISQIRKQEAIAEQGEKTKKRIKELESQLKGIVSKLDDANMGLFLIQLYRIKEGEVITSRVNEKFDKVSWKLFDVQMNGNISEACEAVYDGVPYNEGLNSGHKIHAGLEVIKALSEHYGKSAPVIVDNAESVTDLPEPKDLQLIKLVVSKKHKSLTIEK